MTTTPLLLLFLFLTTTVTLSTSNPIPNSLQKQLPLDPTTIPSSNHTAPAPVDNACRLDLSNELFGGVQAACAGRSLDRSRCCPVLAAWLFAAHARSALQLLPSPSLATDAPLMPDDNQKCVESLQLALEKRAIELRRPNASCDAVLCFCGIRLHQIGSLRCPAAFNVSQGNAAAAGGVWNVTPTAAVRQLEHDCSNASFAGCSRCLHSLDKLKGHISIGIKSSTRSSIARTNMMFGRDCELMGLTWLLAKNKTAYIPAVSAVLRAILYSSEAESKCSSDQENMPLAVDSLQLQHYQSSSSSSSSLYFSSCFGLGVWFFAMLLCSFPMFWLSADDW